MPKGHEQSPAAPEGQQHRPAPPAFDPQAVPPWLPHQAQPAPPAAPAPLATPPAPPPPPRPVPPQPSAAPPAIPPPPGPAGPRGHEQSPAGPRGHDEQGPAGPEGPQPGPASWTGAAPAAASHRWAPPGTTLPGPAGEKPDATVLVTVVAPGGGRTSTRVPADLPVSQLAAGLGAAVNVANVTDIDDDDGTRISAASTLSDAGLMDGATVHVVAPGFIPAAAPRPRLDYPRGPDPLPHSVRRAPAALGVVAAVVVAAVLFVLGGIILGSGGATATGPGPVGLRAAGTWLRAGTFAGPVAPGVPADLDRLGPISSASLQPVGQWRRGAQAGETFVVASPGQAPYGLTVVTIHGKLAFSPTVGPLPFVIDRAPPPAPSHSSGGGSLPASVTAWLQAEFGEKGQLPPVLRLGLARSPTVLASWSPAEGGTVYRMQVPLTSIAPGTPAGVAGATAAAAAAKVTAAAATVATDRASVVKANAAAQATAAALAGAGPTPPPPVTVASDQANAALAAANQKAAADTTALVAAQSAAAALPPASTVPAVSTIATYDVWMRAQSVVGWAPAAYGVTG